MDVYAALKRCLGASAAKVHASGRLEEEHAKALQTAEALLALNASQKLTDMYTLAGPVGHGAFAKVVHCTHIVRSASVSINPSEL